MNRLTPILFLLLSASSFAAPTTRPNILLIVADDMGFSDLGCYGSEIQTPNLDSLARAGLRFTSFYNNARCCPTRASLLTGLYPHQTGVGAMCQDLGHPSYRGQLNNRCLTLAELLKRAGYHTAMVGKWHLANLTISPRNQDSKRILNHQFESPISPDTTSWPASRGFDEHFGTIAGVNDFFDPYSLVHNLEPINPPKDFYYTDFINDQACLFLDALAEEPDTPFFLYVAHTAPHWPLHAKPADIAKYKDTYKIGWDQLRAQRYQRLIEEKIIDAASAPLPPRELEAHRVKVTSWDDAPNKDWESRRMAVYAAQIDRMDQGIGRILQKLRDRNLDENTLILFLSDNGGCAESVQSDWYDIPTRTRDGREIRVGNNPEVLPGDQTTFQSYGPAWANASNTPFRRYKHFTEEGGIATPLIIRWPARIPPARHNQLIPQLSHVIDIVPTCLAAAGAAYPLTHNDKPFTPLEGVNLLPSLDGQSIDRTPLFWEHEGARAVREKNWKLLAPPGAEWQLYNLATDRTELHNVASQHSDIVEHLKALYAKWSTRCAVQPWPLPRD